MNYGPPPPPPPPPFQTGAPPVRLPSEIAAAAAMANKPQMASPPLMMAPPAALAGAMLKDKKPFTYTPGGLNLAEIKSPRMQRRLQRNASLEGVKPSPLAQQPPPSPGGSHTGGSSPIIPPHGMIQVLPMPGMGMAPMTKSQPQKEATPKVKRNVCGPPPPPPPFCISGESSIEPSPPSTPYVTPKEVTPGATSSSTPPSTPGLYSTPTPPSLNNVLPPICNGPQYDSNTSLAREDLQPTMASEPGPSPSIPTPPPPPPSNTNRKNFVVPFPSPPKPPAVQSIAEIIHSPSPQQPPPIMTVKIQVAKLAQQQIVSPELIQDSMSDTNTSSSPISFSQKHNDSSHANSTSLSEREESSSDLSKTSDLIYGDTVKPKESEILIRKLDPVKGSGLSTSDICSNQAKPVVSKVEQNELQNPVETTLSTMKKQTAPVQTQQQEQQKQLQNLNDKNMSINSYKVTNENQNLKPEVLPPVSHSTMNRTIPQESKVTQKLPANQTTDHSHAVAVNHNSEELSKEPQNTNTFRPHWRMASPPPQNVCNETKDAPNSRMVRQASLPAQPFSSPVPPPAVTTGSLYIPPVPVQNNVADCSTTPLNQRPANLSPTSGLAKAPLPWMFAAKKEASPPPEFLVQAQKTQQRLQRQRSFPHQEPKQPQMQQNDQQRLYDASQDLNYVNSFNSYPVSEVRILSPPIAFNCADPNFGSQHTWQSPSQQPTYPPLIQTIQQFSQNTVPTQSLQQPHFAPQANQVPQSNRPRERIIPIMMEDSPPVTPTVGSSNHFTPNNFTASPLSKPNYRPQQTQEAQRQASWPNSRGIHSPTTIPPSSATVNCHNKDEISPVEALQQMQQNLAHLSTSFKTGQGEQNGNLVMPSQFRGSNDMPIQSRSFKVIQNAYDGSSDPIDDSGDFRVLDWTIQGNTDNLKELLKPRALSRKVAPDNPSPSISKQPAENGHCLPKPKASLKVLQAMTDTLPDGSVSQEDQRDHHQPEPRKYAGSSIPSRSFRMLQAMTDTEEGEASVESSLRGKPHLEGSSAANEKPTSKSPLQHSTSSPLTSAMTSPPLTPCSSTMSIPSSCDTERDIGSRIAPSYTSTRDSPAYRQVAPKILKEGDKEDRVVNSALCSRRENSPRPWQLSASPRSLSPVSSPGGTWPPDVDTKPRLLNFLQQEKQISETTPERDEGHHLYDGNKIPSRVFRQLQNDYSKENGSLNHGVGVKITEVPLPRLMKHLNLDRNTRLSVDDDGSSSTSNPDCDTVHMNEMLETAEAKGSVLKELTSHFDPQTSLKKPRAAPGRVFRYLQQQYDDPLDTGIGSTCSSSPVGNRSANESPIPPGNQSRNVSPPNDRSSSISSMSAESGHFELEPKPYVGARIPGRTFRLLQENYDTHPSVIQARK